MWLIHEQKPHYKTIANFRKDNAKAFKSVFRYFVAVLNDWKIKIPIIIVKDNRLANINLAPQNDTGILITA